MSRELKELIAAGQKMHQHAWGDHAEFAAAHKTFGLALAAFFAATDSVPSKAAVPATTPTHKRPLVEYDKNSPVVKALEAAYDEWAQGNCHEVGCGCWTVIANNHLAPVLASQASATTPTPAESYAVGPAELWLADISLRCPKCASPALTSNNKREHRCLHCLTKCTDETALPSVRSLIDKAVENALAQAAAPGGKAAQEQGLLVYPYGGNCKYCGGEISANSGHYCKAPASHPLQDKPPRPENEFPTGFPLHEVPSKAAPRGPAVSVEALRALVKRIRNDELFADEVANELDALLKGK